MSEEGDRDGGKGQGGGMWTHEFVISLHAAED